MDKPLAEKFRAAEVELVYRTKVRAADRPKVRTPEDAYAVLMEHWDHGKISLVEQFNVLMLNNAKACIGISLVATGGTSSCIVDPKIVFVTALKAGASCMVLAHNHPSGTMRPSDADLQPTRRCRPCNRRTARPQQKGPFTWHRPERKTRRTEGATSARRSRRRSSVS